MSKPIDAVSFEFTPTQEFVLIAIDTIKHLTTIGRVMFNYSLGESTTLVLEEWVKPEKISNILLTLPQKTFIWGDIYAKFI